MKRHAQALALFAVALFLIAVPSHSQTTGSNVVLRNGLYYNATTGQQTDASGRVLQVDGNRDRDLVLGQNQIIGDTLSVGMADSSIAFPIGNARHLTFWVDVKGIAGVDTRLAVQLRLHLNSASDSSSMAAWTPGMVFGFNNIARRDSLGTYRAYRDSVGDVGTISAVPMSMPYPDEVLVRWDARRYAAGAGTYYNVPRMKVLTFEVVPGTGSYFSLRVRNLSGSGAARVTVHYRASAL